MARHTRRVRDNPGGFLIILAVVIVLIIAGCGQSRTGSTANPTSDTATVEPATEGQIGQTLTFQDIDVTASSLREAEQFAGRPRTCATISYANRGADEADTALYGWSLTTPGGAVLDRTIGGTDNDLPSAGIIQGGSLTGDLCFDVAYEAGPWVLTWEPSLWTNDTLVWHQG